MTRRASVRTACTGLAVLLLLCLLGVPAASAEDLDSAAKDAEARLVRRLMSVVDWAKGKKITGFRHRVCRRVLVLDPNHRRARALLKYRRTDGGPWVQGDYTEPADWNVGLLPKAEERVTKALTEYRDAMLTALDANPEADPGLLAAANERLIDLLPDDPVVREARGDIQHEGRWVLPETASAEAVRAGYLAKAHEAFDRVRATVRRDTDALKAGWDMGVRTDARRVYGTVPPQVGLAALLNMEVGDALCEELFGETKSQAGPPAAILLTSRTEARSLVQRMRLGDAVLRDLAEVSGMHLPDDEYLCYWRDQDLTKTGGLRHVIDNYLDWTFAGKSRGWITEGVGQRLTWYVTGEHGANFVSLSGTERERDESEEVYELPDDAARWPAAAARVLSRGGPRRLTAVLTMRLNAMKAGDVLVAYGLAAYLLEARPEYFAPFLKASVKRDDASAMVVEVLGADIPTVAWRVRRWLLELR